MDFHEFYYGSYRRLFATVVLLAASRAEAEDALADAYLQALRSWSKVSRLDQPEAWVRRVAVNRAIDQHRRRRRDRRAARLLGPAEPVSGPETSDVPDVVGALAQLNTAQRRVLVLHYVADRSVEQIAAELGMPPGTVKTHLARGRARLASVLRVDQEMPSHD